MYYDGCELLSKKDINGKTPEIYICTTNRTGGKTTYFSRLCVNRFLKQKEKFALLYRYNYELDDIAEKFFKDISGLFFPDMKMTAKRKASGIFSELYLNGIACGYGITLNSADQIKKYSHLFSDVARIMFDEFQSETNHYCIGELTKFLSVHKSIARGQGKQWRYVPVYMIGNPVSLINPYYVGMGISSRLTSETRFLRGDGFVLEQGYVESAAKAQEESGVMRAFAESEYISYSAQGVYLNDNTAFIEQPRGASKYIATLSYAGKDYALRSYDSLGIVYCDNHADRSFPFRLAVTTADHRVNYVMLKSNEFFVNQMRYYFDHGAFRFKDLSCKEAVLKAISY